MTSEDVIHNFSVPAFRLKMDVLPGRYTTAWFKATKTGTYHIFCDQYCGVDHSKMVGKIHVMEPQDYQKWLVGGAVRGRHRRLGRGALRREGVQHLPPPRQLGPRADPRRGLRQAGRPRRRADRPRRRELRPRVDPEPGREGRAGVPADHADLQGPDLRGGDRPAHQVHQGAEARRRRRRAGGRGPRRRREVVSAPATHAATGDPARRTTSTPPTASGRGS